jgi:hypothetical protein
LAISATIRFSVFPVEAHFLPPCFHLILSGIQRNPAMNSKIGKKFVCSFGILRNIELWFCTDVSGQNIGAIYKSQAAQKDPKRTGTLVHSWTA